MGKLTDEVYALADNLAALDNSPLVDMRVDARGGAGSPDWHIIVWDGQVRETGDGVRDYAGLGVLAAASGDTMDDALRAVRDILKRRTENA